MKMKSNIGWVLGKNTEPHTGKLGAQAWTLDLSSQKRIRARRTWSRRGWKCDCYKFLSLFPKRRKVMSYFRSIRLSRHAVISRLSIQGTETKDMTWDCWRGKLILKYSVHLQEVTEKEKSKLQSKMVHLNPNTPATTLNINTFLGKELKKFSPSLSLPLSLNFSLPHSDMLALSFSLAHTHTPTNVHTFRYTLTQIHSFYHTLKT